MGRFGRSIARQATRGDERQRRAAEEYVFRALERQWKDRLKGRHIPKLLKARMRRDPMFQGLVEKRLARIPLVFDHPDVTPETERRPDGTVRSRVQEAFGDDPDRYYCVECEDPLERPGDKLCEPCRQFRETGKVTA